MISRFAKRPSSGRSTSIVANSDQLVKLGWEPELNDLPTMIEHAPRLGKEIDSGFIKLVVRKTKEFATREPPV